MECFILGLSAPRGSNPATITNRPWTKQKWTFLQPSPLFGVSLLPVHKPMSCSRARCSSHRSDIDHCGKFWNAVINSLQVHGWRHASRPESAVVLRFPCDSAFSLVRLVNCLSRSCHVCFSVFVFLVSQAWCCTAPLLLVDIYRRTLIM